MDFTVPNVLSNPKKTVLDSRVQNFGRNNVQVLQDPVDIGNIYQLKLYQEVVKVLFKS